MDNRTIELRVGIVAVLALVVTIWGVIYLKGYRFGQRHYVCSVLFPNVGSLQKGDPLAVCGVAKGKVKEIELSDGKVLVKLSLEKDVVLKKDASFRVMNIGLMGERYVEITTGISDTLLDLSRPAAGNYDTGIPEVMGLLGRGIDEMRDLIAALRGTVASPGYLQRIEQIIENTRKLTGKLNDVIEGNRHKLAQATLDFSASASRLKSMLDSSGPRVDTTLTNFNAAAQRLNKITVGLDSLSKSLHNLTDKVSSGEGTLGKMITDESLYLSLKKATANLDSLVSDIKKNPKRYITVKIF